MYALPTPNANHRHRAVPLYSREGRTERLTVRPSLFEPSSSTLTTSFTERLKVSERVNKAWGFNIVDGTRKPLLRGITPILRRSVGHGFIRNTCSRWVEDHELGVCTLLICEFCTFGTILNDRRAASPYLPTDDITIEGDLKSPLPVSCFFGPLKSQIRQLVIRIHLI